MEKEFLTVKEAAEYLGYTRPYIRTLAKQKKIPAYRRGNNWFFKQKELRSLFKPTAGNGLDL